ncbi:DNA methyltransferase [Arthrobacter woluwensis]|uniref:DNA cytosine methyltransferase n=1 Tax=Arthrobacter woluwensis TaxID=156980 RepID=UPI000D13DACB|nr:DNA cytosine methyltransferase [Arthrobacter woluwensis]PSS43608.1 DNA methyltransferase [Arthrobacter woluwensis]
MTLTTTDLFCGAGGSSTGLSAVPGIEVRTAMNHWSRAIETHALNHPEIDHIEADIQVTDPNFIPRTDILWASPECTNHSVAKGKKRTSMQAELFGAPNVDLAAIKSRATMWDVPRFAEIHRYDLVITENVVDAAKWVMFDAWLMAMRALDYEHHIVYINSMHAQLGGLPAPQSRDRMYVMFWRRGNKRPDFDKLRPRAYCAKCDQVVYAIQAWKRPDQRWGRYRAQYVYRCPNVSCRNSVVEPGWLPAASAIDWSIQGQRIGDRERPLAEKTMARIRAGLEKYSSEPFLSLMRSGRARNYGVGETFQTFTTEGAGHVLVDPLLVPVEGREGKDAQPVSGPMRTQTTRNETGLAVPPLIINNVSGSDASRAATVDDPLRTIVGGGNHASLLVPYYGTGVAKPTTRAMDTVTTVDRHALVTMRGTNAPKHIRDVMDTVTAGGNHHGLMSTQTPSIEDCTFRMLEPHETTWGMAFPRDYVMTGTKRDQVKQAGNSVCPPNARDLGIIGAESLAVA